MDQMMSQVMEGTKGEADVLSVSGGVEMGFASGNELLAGAAAEMESQSTQKPLRGEQVHIDFDDFETPRAEMFGDTKSPAFTVNGRVVGANSVCVRQLGDVDYVEFAISQNRKMLLLVPCSEFVVQGYKWAREKDGKRYATTRTGVPFVLSICQMMGWDPNQRHRIPGKLINSEGIEMMSFDLTAAKHFDKPTDKKGSRSQVIFTGDWDGHFGPKFSESRRTFQVDKFDQLTVWSIKEGNTEQAYVLPEENASQDGEGIAIQSQLVFEENVGAEQAAVTPQAIPEKENGIVTDNAGEDGGMA